jgi:hypothetical protein
MIAGLFPPKKIGREAQQTTSSSKNHLSLNKKRALFSLFKMSSESVSSNDSRNSVYDHCMQHAGNELGGKFYDEFHR